MHPNSLANLRPAPPWQPGKSGNSRGSSRAYRRVLRAAREASPEAIDKLIECMRDTTADWHQRIRACDIILDRAWGSEARIDVDLNADKVNQITIVIERGALAEQPVPEPELIRPAVTIDALPLAEGDHNG